LALIDADRPVTFTVLTEFLDYSLPESRIAQRPTSQRDGARLLVVGQETLEDRCVREWPQLVPPGALVVLNETRVLRARVYGQREGSGGKVELLLLEAQGADAQRPRWLAMGRANRPLRAGTPILVGGERLQVVETLPDGVLVVELAQSDVVEWLQRVGHVPLPPYVKRPDDEQDDARYQTVFASEPGAVAAPTAGLHLTRAMLTRLGERGVDIGKLTLHVGAGTFAPVKALDLDEHPMHTERYSISETLVAQVAAARARGAPVVAVGTTVVRALESARDERRPGLIRACSTATRLLIQPGYRFGVVDALLTNFHAPRSTLLALVAAFIGLERMRVAYAAALQRDYRFLSYGDAMWLPQREDSVPSRPASNTGSLGVGSPAVGSQRVGPRGVES